MKWSDTNRIILKQLREAGISFEGCAFACSMIQGKRISVEEVASEYWNARRLKITKRAKSQLPSRAENIAACILHHADLIRAGHSPANTEYDIESDGLPIIISVSRTPDRSSCGSSSALCADATV